MGDKKDLQSTEALQKISELAKELKMCMFCTYEDGKLKSRPMALQDADEAGYLWFFSKKGSDKNNEIQKDNNVDLLFGDGGEKYLAINGTAEITENQAKVEEFWNPFLKVWFTEGKNDPSISVIKIKFNDGYYWDIKHNRMISLAKMGVALLTGTTNDDGIEGALD